MIFSATVEKISVYCISQCPNTNKITKTTTPLSRTRSSFAMRLPATSPRKTSAKSVARNAIRTFAGALTAVLNHGLAV